MISLGCLRLVFFFYLFFLNLGISNLNHEYGFNVYGYIY